MRLAVGIVGCGAIGTSLAGVIRRSFKSRARLCALFDVDREKARRLSRALQGSAGLAVSSLQELIRRSSLVIEAACAADSARIARQAIAAKRDVLVLSVGGLLGTLPALERAARRTGARLYLPSGAIAGLDAVKALRAGGLVRVTLTTRKHPSSLPAAAAVRKKRVVFEGNALEAVRRFPQNINVAAALSIAGLGARRTRVRIVADPAARRNIHEIEVVAKAGRGVFRTENVLHPRNRKTSYLAVLSAVEVVRGILSPVKIGT